MNIKKILDYKPTPEELAQFSGEKKHNINTNKYRAKNSKGHAYNLLVLQFKEKLIREHHMTPRVDWILGVDYTDYELAKFVGVSAQAIGKSRNSKGHAYQRYLLEYKLDLISKHLL